MAINKNHEFEEIEGKRCAIVEKNAGKVRVDFLQSLLECNRYEVIVIPSPPPKPAPAPTANTEGGASSPELPASPETFTVAVTDVMFNPINAIFGRLLKTAGGHIVTLAYWNQQESIPSDEIPYYENVA